MDRNEYIEKLKARLSEKPDSPVFLSLAGEYRNRGDMSAAMETLLSGAGRRPDMVNARLSLAGMYLSNAMTGEAKAVYREIVERDPGNIAAWRGLGLSHLKLGNDREAANAFRNVLALDPFDEQARNYVSTPATPGEKERVVNDLRRFSEALRHRFAGRASSRQHTGASGPA